MKAAYGRQTPAPDHEPTCVEPGSPMGELMRRYWQPVCTFDELHEVPRKEKAPVRGDCRVPRQEAEGRRPRSALRASRHLARMGPRRGGGAALPLSRLALRY